MISKKTEQPLNIALMPGDTMTIKYNHEVDGVAVSEVVMDAVLVTTELHTDTVAVVEFTDELGFAQGVAGVIGRKK